MGILTRRGFLSLSLTAAAFAAAAIPTPKEHLGYTPGDDFKLADYADVTSYFRKLAAASDRIRLAEFGKSAEGKPMLVAYLSSAENLRQLDRWRDISRRLALGKATQEEARKLAAEGKVIVWIDSGLHASEVAPVQHSFDLAYRMVTGEDPDTALIRDKVILMQVPAINPDGLDWIAHWYRGNVGTPHELAPLPRLYQKYAGHDNNRDWFMLNLEETRHVTKLLFRDWFPQIVYNQHQAPAFPARIFVPPYAEPLNPNIPAAVMEGINTIGSAMKERFAREGKPGVISYTGYDAWWNGGLRSVPAFHNMHGILTETALHGYATPGNYKKSDLPERFSNGIPTREPSVFYQRPWLGGRWSVRDAIDYMLTADFAILELAASRSSHFLYKAWDMAQMAIHTGKGGSPYGYIVPAGQWDMGTAVDMVRRLEWSGIEVHRARAEFRANGSVYAAGSYVLLAAQPFRAHLVDLMEPQKYPEIKSGQTGPTKRPYDVAGWTLSMNMGVQAIRAEDTFAAELEPVSGIALPEPSRSAKENSSFLALANALESSGKAYRSAAGDLVDTRPESGWEVRRPRVALYEPWVSNMDTGWTQYLLDQYKIPYTILRNADFAKPLTGAFDAIVMGSQSATSILHGARPGESAGRGRTAEPSSLQRPEYTGGIGVAGLAHLDAFVRAGGMLVTLDDASGLPIQFFPLPLRSAIGENSSFYCPGSLLRIQVDTSHPLALGMPKEAYAFTTGGQAWDITLLKEYNKGDREVKSVARYASANLLASGWLSGEKTVAGKHIVAEARHGAGRVVMFGFRPQFRAQSAGTFKFLLNAIYLSSSKQL